MAGGHSSCTAVGHGSRRLSEAIEKHQGVEGEGLRFVAMLRRYIAIEEAGLLPALVSMEAVCEPDTASATVQAREEERFRDRFAQLSHEAGCECDYE